MPVLIILPQLGFLELGHTLTRALSQANGFQLFISYLPYNVLFRCPRHVIKMQDAKFEGTSEVFQRVPLRPTASRASAITM